MTDNERYHADTTRISKSGLDKIAKCPALYYSHYLDPQRPAKKSTEALTRGSAFHSIILEPDKFAKEFAVDPGFKGQGSKNRKESFLSTCEGKQVITLEMYETVSRMRDSAFRHPMVKDLLQNGRAEHQLNFEDPATGARVKTKPDFHDTNNNLIIDLKSTTDASISGFAMSSYKYRYHVQAPLYLDAARFNSLNTQGFVFIAVESKWPHLVNVFFATPDIVSHGREIYQSDLRVYSQCLHSNQWPGYETKIQPLGLPSFVKL